MKRFLSRYAPSSVASLVYMLQATEYRTGEYLRWFWRADDLRRVQKRKHLVMTKKAILLITFAWMSVAVVAGAAGYAALSFTGAMRIMIPLALLVFGPFLIAYGIIVPLLIMQPLQHSYEKQRLARARRILASHKGMKIAIAGSYGKTSMREILRTVLSASKNVASPPHSYNTPLAITKFVESLKGDENVVLFELGEYKPGDVKTLCEAIHPDLGIITGVNEAHLEQFKDLSRTTDTIFELADFLGNRPLYVNAENATAKNRAIAPHTLFDRNGAGPWKVHASSTDLTGTRITAEHEGVTIELTSGLLGLHMVGPLMAAAAIGHALKIPTDDIVRGIAATVPFEHRLQPRTDAQGVITLDDSYNGNPDGVRAVIDFLATLNSHRRFYVTPGLVEMGDRTEAIHREIGTALTRAAIEKIVLIKDSVTPFIEQGLRSASFTGEVLWYADMPSALAALPHLTVSGDVVLFQNDWPDQYV